MPYMWNIRCFSGKKRCRGLNKMKTKQQIINDMKKEIDADIRHKDGYIADIMAMGMEMGVTRTFFEMNEFISVTDSERLVMDVEKVLKNTSLFMSFPEIYPLLIKQNSYWNKRTEPSLAISFGMSWEKYSNIIGHDIVNGRLQSGNYTTQQSRYYIKGRPIHNRIVEKMGSDMKWHQQ